MKVFFGLLLILLHRSRAFTPCVIRSYSKNWISNGGNKKTKHNLSSAANESDQYEEWYNELSDQYEEWYNELDPSQFDRQDQEGAFSSPSEEAGHELDASQPTYVQSELCTSTAHDDVFEIQALVDKRAKAIKKRKWNKVVDMRQQLFRQFQVNVNDERKEWSVGPDCFGPNGHDYRLAADAGPNISTLSEPQIHEMLSTRLQHKMIKDFRTANLIRNKLRSAGVELNDQGREWRADGATFPGVARKYAQSKFSEPTEDVDEIQALVDKRAKAFAERRWSKALEIRVDLFRQFRVNINDNRKEWSVGPGCLGTNGHYYKLAADAGFNRSTFSWEKIHEMLSSRLQHKLIEDFDAANMIRNQLRTAGVEIADRKREWRADGKDFFNPGRLGVAKYIRSKWSASPANADEIQALVDERSKGRADKLWSKVDDIRVILHREYGVVINDQTLEWSVGPHCLGPNGHYYNLVADAGPNQSTMTESEIHEMLSARLQHLLIGDWRTGRKLKNDLRKAGVEVKDSTKEWRADGDVFHEVAVEYSRSKSSLATKDADEIQALLDERAEAIAEGQPKKAEEISFSLLRRFQVLVNDSTREWSVGGDCFGPKGHDFRLAADAGPNRSTLSEPQIHEMLATRLKLQFIRDHRNAARIRKDLVNAGVEINEKTREWRADGILFDELVPKYVQSKLSKSTSDFDAIQAMIDERAHVRMKRLFENADAIRKVLFRRYHVCINDERKEWSVGGSCLGPNGHNFELARGAGPNQSTLSEPEIHEMLSTRLQYKLVHDYDAASKVRIELKNAGVAISDRAREWRADGRTFQDYRRRGGGSLSVDEVKEITRLLDLRRQFNMEKKSKQSAKIRAQLRDKFNVSIDDKRREWYVVTSA